MVFESIMSPLKAESHPSRMILVGFVYVSIGLFLALWVFNDQASLTMVFLTTMAMIPLVYNIIKLEEKKDLSELTETNLILEHGRALQVFMYYFIGATLSFSFWYAVLPAEIIGTLFNVQAQTIAYIRASVTANASQSVKIFSLILTNNLKVLIFCILFSFLYGLGAIFILTWNASVIGVAIGSSIRSGITQIGRILHFSHAVDYFSVISWNLLRYVIHGIPEIAAYFFAGLAGGIISVAVIRHDFGTKKYEKIVFDSSILLIISLVLLVVAAFLEVFVTPVIFPYWIS